MLTSIFLWLNAGMYALFSLWCTFAPTAVMRFLGQSVVAKQGLIEFITVYGGLQAGLAVFFTVCGFVPSMSSSGVYFALCVYGGIVIWRSGAFLIHGLPQDKGILAVFALEVLLLLLAIGAWSEVRLRQG